MDSNKLKKEAAKIKAKLIKKASKSGLYENFGITEIRCLEDKYKPDYSSDGRIRMAILSELHDWCISYEG